MTNAIMAMSNNNLITNSSSRRARVMIHGVLQGIAGVFIATAFTTIVLHKNRNGSSHFSSLHGIFGLTAVILTSLTVIGGIPTNYSFQFRNLVRPIIIKILHSLLGMLNFLFGMIALGYGIYSRWFGNRYVDAVQGIFLAIIVLVTLYVLYRPVINFIQRFKASMAMV